VILGSVPDEIWMQTFLCTDHGLYPYQGFDFWNAECTRSSDWVFSASCYSWCQKS